MAVNVNAVAKQYDINVFQMSRGRGAFILKTDKGIKLLKEYEGKDAKTELIHSLLAAVMEAGFMGVDAYVLSAEGKLIVTDEDGRRFYMKNWYEARECDIYNSKEVLESCRQLALLHNTFDRIDNRQSFCGKTINEKDKYERHLREIKKIYNYIRNKKSKSDFEKLIFKNAPYFVEDAARALELFEECNYDQYFRNACSLYEICHGDYNYHNILFDNEFVAITDFDNIRCDVRISDLYNFMRKTLEKNDWEAGLGLEMIAAYNQYKEISDSERRLLGASLLFPEKFWKVINAYFNSRKTLILQKNVTKLEQCIWQSDRRRAFALEVLQ